MENINMGNTGKIDINLSESTDISLAMINDWELPPQLINKMDNYYVLHWTYEWFLKQLHKSMIFKDNKCYLVLDLDKLNGRTNQVALSFRACKALNNLHGYVLVRRIK